SDFGRDRESFGERSDFELELAEIAYFSGGQCDVCDADRFETREFDLERVSSWIETGNSEQSIFIGNDRAIGGRFSFGYGDSWPRHGGALGVHHGAGQSSSGSALGELRRGADQAERCDYERYGPHTPNVAHHDSFQRVITAARGIPRAP